MSHQYQLAAGATCARRQIEGDKGKTYAAQRLPMTIPQLPEYSR